MGMNAVVLLVVAVGSVVAMAPRQTVANFDQATGARAPLFDADLSDLGLAGRSRRSQHPQGEGDREETCLLPDDQAEEMRRGITFFLGARYALSPLALSDEERCRLRRTDITVASGKLDSIKVMMDVLQLAYTSLNASASEAQLRHALRRQPCRVVLLNSGAHVLDARVVDPKIAALAPRLLKRFVNKGGTLLTSDDAVSVLGRRPFPLNDWTLKPKGKRAQDRTLHLERGPSLNVSVLQLPNSCVRDRKVVSVLDNLTNLLERIPPNLQTNLPWHLESSSQIVKLHRHPDGNQRLFCLVRTEDLPSRRDCVLACGDTGKGSYFHVVGPLAQTFPVDQQMTSPPPSPFTQLMFNLFRDKDMLLLTDQESQTIASQMTQLRACGHPILVEDVATAAISATWLTRVALQSWRSDCRAQLAQCQPHCQEAAAAGSELPADCAEEQAPVTSAASDAFRTLHPGSSVSSTAPTATPAVVEMVAEMAEVVEEAP